MFFSIDLNTALQPYFNKIEINSQNAKIGVEKRRKKIEKQVQQLENKLSESDSSERPLSDGSATAEQREEKRREEKRTTTSAHEAEKSEIEKCSSSEFLSFASEKAEKNAKNKPAYIASLVARYENGDPSVILEFEEFEKARKKESIDDILYQFRNKTVNVNGSNYVLIGVEQSKIENEYILFSKCGKRLLANTSTLMHIFHSQLKGA
jgi:flagellar biosynthesis GTPase FlhF